MFSQWVKKLNSFVSGIPFDTLVWYVWGSYAAIFAVALILTLITKKMKRASKIPFLCLTNAYTGVNLALYLSVCELAEAVMISALFWVAGYILYLLLCACSVSRQREAAKESGGTYITGIPAQPAPTVPKTAKTDVPAAKNSVRLEHAASVTEKLLSKNLGRSDRQELEKLKNTLAVLRIKGTLTPAESEILNENFNTLLKLMAKYNI